MTRRTRRIIFYLFLMAFIFLAPMIILYARGYTFDWDEKTIVATGGIYLKSYPSGAEIFVNEKPKGKTSGYIKRLVPKAYEVKIIKENYHPWQKNLTVKPELVTKASNVLLVPFNPKISLVSKNEEIYSEIYSSFKNPYPANLNETIKKKSKYTIFDINNVNFDPKKERIYFLSNNNLYYLDESLSPILISNVLNYVLGRDKIIYLEYFTGQIYELNLDNLESKPIFEQVFPSLNQGEWILSLDGKKLLCKKDKSVEILWLEEVVNNSIIREKGDIEKINFGQRINNVIWHPKTDKHLIISTNDSILVTELDNRPPRNTINFITTEKPQIQYNAKEKKLYFLSQDRLYRTNL